jgi:hypothetical protein
MHFLIDTPSDASLSREGWPLSSDAMAKLSFKGVGDHCDGEADHTRACQGTNGVDDDLAEGHGS